jgi:hypothetical protein
MEILNRIKGKQMAAAGAAVGAMASAAQASVTYTPANITVSSAGTNSVNVDVNNDAADDFTLTASTSSGLQIQKANSPTVINGAYADQMTTDTPPVTGNAFAMNYGDAVPLVTSPSAPVYDTLANIITADGSTGYFTTGAGPKYIGVSLLDAAVSGNDDTQRTYGYIKFQTLSTGTTVSGQILGYGWESQVNTPISAGAGEPVPEPASLGLLAMGAAGLLAKRPRRAR